VGRDLNQYDVLVCRAAVLDEEIDQPESQAVAQDRGHERLQHDGSLDQPDLADGRVVAGCFVTGEATQDWNNLRTQFLCESSTIDPSTRVVLI
jgi:hypothetical protein